jgi:hypothetical protein
LGFRGLAGSDRIHTLAYVCVKGVVMGVVKSVVKGVVKSGLALSGHIHTLAYAPTHSRTHTVNA